MDGSNSKNIDIMLISPSNENLGLFHDFVPRSVPIALGILASYLMKHNYKTEIADQELIKIDEEFLKNKIKSMEKPAIFGISMMTTNAMKSYEIAKIIKSIDKDAIIIGGGIHPTVAPEEVLKTGCLDFVVRGEGERAVLELLNKIRNGDNNYSTIENLVYCDENKNIIYNNTEKDFFDVNELPLFPFYLFDKDKYDLGAIFSSRGCPFNCIFCSQRAITKGKYRYRRNDLVIQDMDYLINEAKVKNIGFYDDFFLADKKRIFELCQMIRERGFHKNCSFGIQTRADSVNEEVLKEMKKSGFVSISFGFETSSNHLMKVIKKGETVEDNINAIKLAKELGFDCEASFIFGLPEETYKDRINALKIAKTIGLDRARYNNATPYPGTEFYNIALAQNKLCSQNGWKNFSSTGALTSGIFSSFMLPYCPEGTNPKDLAGEVLLANLLFFLNFKKVKKLFNLEQKGSGKFFEVSHSKLFNIKILFKLMTLGFFISLKAIYFLISSKECRKFFAESFQKYDFIQ